MYENMELRKLSIGPLSSLIDVLETNNDWKKVMSHVPMNPLSDVFVPKYNNEHMRLIEEHSKLTGKKCSEILFEEWSTSGRVRPTLTTLKNVVIKAGIYRAADQIAVILSEPLPSRPQVGPAAEVPTDITELLKDESMEQRLDDMHSIETEEFNSNSKENLLYNGTTRQMKSASDLIKFSSSFKSDVLPDFSALCPDSEVVDQLSSSTSNILSDAVVSRSTTSTNISISPYGNEKINYVRNYQMSLPNIDFDKIDSEILQDTTLTKFSYKEIETITDAFSEVHKIGSGGFGEVYMATHPKSGPLAIKRIRNQVWIEYTPEVAMKVFNTEVASLSLLRHENIVPILGYSIDGPSACIICKYIEGGSLEHKLTEKVLNATQRINIMLGTAKGLKYIHNTVKPIQNEDLTKSYTTESQSSSKKNYFLHGDVKSANILLTLDFTPKLCDFGLAKQCESTFVTKSMMGTSAYMAPEGFSGTITQKNDIFSFGIVLLELLTGMKPIHVIGSERLNIKTYIEENSVNADISNLLDPAIQGWDKAPKIYELAQKCLKHNRNERPSMDLVCDRILTIKNEYSNYT